MEDMQEMQEILRPGRRNLDMFKIRESTKMKILSRYSVYGSNLFLSPVTKGKMPPSINEDRVKRDIFSGSNQYSNWDTYDSTVGIALERCLKSLKKENEGNYVFNVGYINALKEIANSTNTYFDEDAAKAASFLAYVLYAPWTPNAKKRSHMISEALKYASISNRRGLFSGAIVRVLFHLDNDNAFPDRVRLWREEEDHADLWEAYDRYCGFNGILSKRSCAQCTIRPDRSKNLMPCKVDACDYPCQAYYCSEKCQKKHRIVHNDYCKKV